jgi:hypothetical protein
MAHTHDSDLDMTDAREPTPPSEERENRRLAFTSLWLVLAVLVVVIVGTFLIVSHRAGHATALTPGQPQKPAAVILGGNGG